MANGQPATVLQEKGSSGDYKTSELWGDNIHTCAGQSVHQKCRRGYCNKNVISRDLKAKSAISTTTTTGRPFCSQEPVFNYREHCLFCAQPIQPAGESRGYDDTVVLPVRTKYFQATVERIYKQQKDSWSDKVNSIIGFAQDLHATDAVYHQGCSISFRTGKQIALLY